ncbi:hypothetical protein PoB_001740400 [Plakobranchus ocellatus]|uniref:Uncharacterized protein n=1 Tax=Plakobranchus ocellatus TaxID=259542 RepID=A0AAV3Z6E2_9GAST|nr:hypothetical protein PoB_001740400 [Plakobranchus ocellatus]
MEPPAYLDYLGGSEEVRYRAGWTRPVSSGDKEIWAVGIEANGLGRRGGRRPFSLTIIRQSNQAQAPLNLIYCEQNEDLGVTKCRQNPLSIINP